MSETTYNGDLKVLAEMSAERVAEVSAEVSAEAPGEAYGDVSGDVPQEASVREAGVAGDITEEASMRETGVAAGKEILVQVSGADIINDGNRVLSNVNVEIAKGEWVYLLGKVGSGKSSIIKTLIAELPLKKGAGSVLGFQLEKIKKRQIPYLRRKLGVVFQDFQLLMDMTVEENLMFVLEATGWSRSREMRARVQEVLQMVGLPDKLKKMPHQLSGGEQQRVAIARALLNSPQLILADEPTGNLDEETASEIMKVFSGIHSSGQASILMVTHNRELTKRFPGRVLVCEAGTVYEQQEEEIDFELM